MKTSTTITNPSNPSHRDPGSIDPEDPTAAGGSAHAVGRSEHPAGVLANDNIELVLYIVKTATTGVLY